MLTGLDHWLRDKFLYQTHIYTMSLPPKLPAGVRKRKLPESATSTHRYCLISNSSKTTKKLVNRLDEAGMLYMSKVTERKTFLRPIICPRGGSLTLMLLQLAILGGIAFGLYRGGVILFQNEKMVENLKGAFGILTESEES